MSEEQLSANKNLEPSDSENSDEELVELKGVAGGIKQGISTSGSGMDDRRTGTLNLGDESQLGT